MSQPTLSAHLRPRNGTGDAPFSSPSASFSVIVIPTIEDRRPTKAALGIPLLSAPTPARKRFDARKLGGVLLRFQFPSHGNFHVNLYELGDPRIIRLLASLTRLFGVPRLLPPTSEFVAALITGKDTGKVSI